MQTTTADAVNLAAGPSVTSGLARKGVGNGRTEPSRLMVVDEILAEYHLERRIASELQARTTADRASFGRAATHALHHVVRPALESVAERLGDDGAGGRVDEFPAADRRGARIVLWMSLDGPIVREPRQDLNPYLQLQVDIDGRQVRVWEGDMWLRLGSSRPAPAVTLEELTPELVLGRATEVLRRAAAHAQVALTTLVQEGDAP